MNYFGTGEGGGGEVAAAVVVTQIYYDEEPKGFVWANIDEISSTRRSHAFSSERLPPWEDSIWGFALIWRNTYPRWSGGGTGKGSSGPKEMELIK